MEENRIGIGYDVHAFAEGRKLILGGTVVPFEQGLLGHSDADVLTHAVMDALLGAAGLGDIGKHFPDTDEKYRGISSLNLLADVRHLLREQNCTVMNIDAVVVAQRPRLAPHMTQMKQNIAGALAIEPERVNIKATTTEGLGFEGRGEGISAQAVCSIIKNVNR
jgi:2-C-methyl-D-erythritol 2,4-cyclodiphosphate synthase